MFIVLGCFVCFDFDVTACLSHMISHCQKTNVFYFRKTLHVKYSFPFLSLILFYTEFVTFRILIETICSWADILDEYAIYICFELDVLWKNSNGQGKWGNGPVLVFFIRDRLHRSSCECGWLHRTLSRLENMLCYHVFCYYCTLVASAIAFED